MAKRKTGLQQRAWRKLGRRPHSATWRSFEKEFGFKPSVYADKWPSITEPKPSQTWNLKEIFSAPSPDDLRDGVVAINTSCHDALCAYLKRNDSVYVLDWQHYSYEFWPHRFSRAQAEDVIGSPCRFRTVTIPFMSHLT